MSADPITQSILVGIGGAVGGGVISSLLGKESPLAETAATVPPPPTIEAPKTMPTPNDAAVKQAKKRSIASMRARKGRASTILTADTAISDALGG